VLTLLSLVIISDILPGSDEQLLLFLSDTAEIIILLFYILHCIW